MEGSVGERILLQAEAAAAAEPAPDDPIEAIEHALDGHSDSKREARRQRRKSRPHGRAR